MRWTELARADVRDMRTYSIERRGGRIAAAYLSDLNQAARSAAADPSRLRVLRQDIRILAVRSHFLVFKADAASDMLTVARVLHSSMDLARHLPDTDSA